MADGEKQYIQLPDGSYGEFPAEMKDEEIRAAIDKEYKPSLTQSAERFARSVPSAIKGMAGEAWRSAVTPSAPTKEGARTEPTFGRKILNVIGAGEGALFGGTGEAGGIGGGGYRAEDVAAPFVLGAGEAATPVIGAAASKYMPTTTAAARSVLRALTPAETPAPATMPTTRPRLAETLPTNENAPRPPARPPVPSAAADLERISQRMFKQPYDSLPQEKQLMVIRNVGAPEAAAERRVTVGKAPTMERRAEAMPKPQISPEFTERRVSDIGPPAGGLDQRAVNRDIATLSATNPTRSYMLNDLYGRWQAATGETKNVLQRQIADIQANLHEPSAFEPGATIGGMKKPPPTMTREEAEAASAQRAAGRTARFAEAGSTLPSTREIGRAHV